VPNQNQEGTAMTLAVAPSQIVITSVAVGITFPLFLIALSRRPFLVRDLMRRFHLSCVLAVVLWAGVILSGGEFWRFDAKAISDVLAGALILSSFMLTTLIVWLLLGTGMSMSLLVSLAANAGPVEVEAWLADYGNGFGLRDAFVDRLRLLLSTRAAFVDQSRIVVARRARLSVTVLEAAMSYFNFPK
jgi:hypothetical protein